MFDFSVDIFASPPKPANPGKSLTSPFPAFTHCFLSSAPRPAKPVEPTVTFDFVSRNQKQIQAMDGSALSRMKTNARTFMFGGLICCGLSVLGGGIGAAVAKNVSDEDANNALGRAAVALALSAGVAGWGYRRLSKLDQLQYIHQNGSGSPDRDETPFLVQQAGFKFN